jgi:ABC-type glycerol-3-phosphate transport system permease component
MRADVAPFDARRIRRRRTARTALNYAALVVGAIIVLFPLYVTVVNSLLPSNQLIHQPPPLLPLHPQWSDYPTAWNAPGSPLSTDLLHSLIVTALITSGQIVTSVLAAYAFAFLRFPFRRALFVTFLARVSGNVEQLPESVRAHIGTCAGV